MTPWLILPFKSIEHGKSRLAPALGAEQRRALNRHLLRHALTVAAQYPGQRHTLVVSACPHVLAIARDHGCHALSEKPPGGLNGALTHAIHVVRRHGGDDLMLLSCDLPFVHTSDLEALMALGRRQGGVLVATDRCAQGTNALYLSAATRIELHYGPDSCRLHLAQATRLGLPAGVLHRAGLAFDIDTPADLRTWAATTFCP